VLNQEQEKKIIVFRQQYAEYAAQIAGIKDDQKQLFEDLVETLKLDKKIDKEKIRDIKRGFKLFVKANAPEEVASVGRAAEVAYL